MASGRTLKPTALLEKMSPPKVLILSFLILGVIPTIVATTEGNAFFSKDYPEYPFFGKFFIWPVSFLFLFPLMNAIASNFYRTSREALKAAIDDGIFTLEGKSRTTFESMQRRMTSKIKNTIVAVTAVVITAGYWFGPTLMFQLDTWCHGRFGGYSALFFVIIVLWYGQIFLVLSALIDFVLWVRLESFLTRDGSTHFAPILLHPDNAAGLSRFGHAALHIYFFVFSLMVFVMLQVGEKMVSDPDLTLLQICVKYKAVPANLGVLFILLPFSFFLPLLPFYQKLSDFRLDYFSRLTTRLRAVEAKLLSVGEAGKTTQKEYLEELELLQQLYALGKRIPRWPFDVRTLQSFSVSTLIPIVAVIMELIGS